MRRLLTLVVLSVVASPLGARADGSLQLGARAGAALPFGDIGDGQKLSDSISWEFPLEASVQFRLFREFSLGAYGRFAPSVVKSGCTGCVANDLGLGGVAEYRFSDKLEGGPWVGVHAGWEQLKVDEQLSVGKVTRTLAGFEGGVATGIDYELGAVTLGPYVQLAIGGYTRSSAGGVTQTIFSKGAHAFLAGGLRMTLLL